MRDKEMERHTKILSGITNIATETCAQLIRRSEHYKTLSRKLLVESLEAGTGEADPLPGLVSGGQLATCHRFPPLPCRDFLLAHPSLVPRFSHS